VKKAILLAIGYMMYKNKQSYQEAKRLI